MKRAFLILSCLTLLLVSALFAWNATREYPESTVQLPIAQYLPGGISDGPGRHPVRRSSESEGGWAYEDLPLGATESMEERTQDVLNMTDYVYRRYTYVGGGGVSDAGVSDFRINGSPSNNASASADPRATGSAASAETPASGLRPPAKPPISRLPSSANLRPGDSFEVYVAYWAPGAQSVREVSIHVPDKCWTAAGWEITQREDHYVFGDETSGGTTVSVSGVSEATAIPASSGTESIAETSTPPVPPCRWRVFENGGQQINVVFWHFLNGRPYESMALSPWKRGLQFLTTPFQNEVRRGGEQWLIRISSQQDLRELEPLLVYRAATESMLELVVN